MRQVTVVEYNSAWPLSFELEAAQIKDAVGSTLLDIHHIGSTAVRGMKAKPIIDILAVVNSLKEFDRISERVISLRYEALGEFGIPRRRFFQKGGNQRSHHLHVFELTNTTEITKHLVFRDYLRIHQSDAEFYGQLKMRLSQEYSEDINSYMNGKSEVVKSLTEKARRYFAEKSKF